MDTTRKRRTWFGFVFIFVLLFSGRQGYSQTITLVPENQKQTKQLSDKEKADLDNKKLSLVGRILSVNDPEIIKKLYDFFVVYDHVKNEYVDIKNPVDLLNLSMVGMVNGLDPYSNLFVDKDAELISRRLSGEENFVGVGIVIMNLYKNVVITEVIENSPAARAGLQPGDIISRVNNESVFGMNIDKVASLVRGVEGAPVVLEIKSARFQKPKSFTIVRRSVVVNSVSYKDLKGGLAYIKIRSFLPETPSKFLGALERSLNKKGLIVDLRDNSGGARDAVNMMVGFFVGPGQTLITAKGKNVNEDVVTLSTAVVGLPKIVLLINNFSASASEIMAGNLKHYKIATLVGIRTFGKATAQRYVALDGKQLGDSRLIVGLTIARFYLPDGSDITGNGVQPDLEIEQPENFKQFEYLTKRDRQFQEALRILKKK